MQQNKKSENQIFIEKIVAEIPVSGYWMNKKFIYLGCSNSMAELLELSSRQDIVGKSYQDLYDEKSAICYQTADSEVMNKGVSLTVEEPLYFSNGTKKMYLSKKIPLYDGDEIIGMLGISVDITDRKKMEEELRVAKEAAEAANHAKTEFIANMGHDIRTPLTGIIGMSTILEEEVQHPEEKAHATMIHQSGDQLLGLLNGVLDLITVDATNEDMVQHEVFDVRQVIDDVTELERPAVEAKHLSITTHVDEAIPLYMVGDKIKLHRILLNLTGNAVKFTKAGGIKLSAELKSIEGNEAKILFAVKDTGIGIPSELQNKVFDRFFKVSPSYKGLYAGNGIGLHIAHKYVDLMQGNIQLTSEVGVGTTFSFVLPMKIGQAPAEKINKSVEAAPLARGSTPIKTETLAKEAITTSQPIDLSQFQVLLVEDNATALNVLKIMVKKFNVQISAAMDAETALELVKKQHFDLIITDLGLPQKSGDEMTVAIRAYEQNNGLKPMTIV